MPIYKLIEHSNNYLKTSGSLQKYHKDDLNNNIPNSEFFKLRGQIAGITHANGNTKDVKIAVPLKYLSNFQRTLEIRLIESIINFMSTWSANCIITSSTDQGTFRITDTKHSSINYVKSR